jgi:lipopolysaccharide transport system permease protein
MVNYIKHPFRKLYKNRDLIWELSKRDISEKYKGQPLGIFWAFFHPLVLVLLYIFLFAGVFKMKMGGTVDMPLSYPIYMLSGVIPWLCFQTSLNAGSISIVQNASFVKQAIFPVEVFPIKSMGSSILIEFIYLFFMFFYVLVYHRLVFWTYLFLPLLIFFQIICLIGINYLCSSIGTYYRDLKDIVQVFCSVGIYIMPIVYLPDAVPRIFIPFLYINPFSHFIWMFQDVLYYGKFLHWYSWIIAPIFSIVVFYFGNFIFGRLKYGFGSVL